MSLVITPALSTTARFAARASLPLVALGLALLAAPAHADVAEGWSDPADVDALHALLLLGGVPRAALRADRAGRLRPGRWSAARTSRPRAVTVESQWIGGPRPDAKELAAGDTESSETGGARGSW